MNTLLMRVRLTKPGAAGAPLRAGGRSYAYTRIARMADGCVPSGKGVAIVKQPSRAIRYSALPRSEDVHSRDWSAGPRTLRAVPMLTASAALATAPHASTNA